MLCKVSWKGCFRSDSKEQSMDSLGIDVSKYSLKCSLGGEVRDFPNTSAGHSALIEWAGDARIWCMEATGRFHERVALAAFEKGIPTAVVNPGQAKKYLQFVSHRAKTDRVDAETLARLGEREGENLRAFKPVPAAVASARDILVRRKALIESKVSLEQVSESAGDPQGHLTTAVRAIKSTVKELEKELAQTLKDYEGYKHLLTIPGIGPLSAAILVCTLERGEFATSDSLVAFAGLDPRANDSGRHKGRRALSHHGDAQLRTILFMAARAASRLPEWKPYYINQIAKGYASTAATVILARKLLRVSWSVYRGNHPFIPKGTDALDIPT